MIATAAAWPQPLLVALGALLGLIAGSFIGALVMRWPRAESIAHGRSRCDACDRVLRPRELVPLLSYLASRGRCAACGARIAPVHAMAEMAAALVGASAFAFAPMELAMAGLVFGWVLVALALLDLEHLWLPDRLTLPLGLAGLASAALGNGPSVADSLIGTVTGYAALAVIAFAYKAVRGRTGIGGGDPKLLGAIGAWLGWAMLPYGLLLASLLGLTWVAVRIARGTPVERTDVLPLGTLMAASAWPLWLATANATPLF